MRAGTAETRCGTAPASASASAALALFSLRRGRRVLDAIALLGVFGLLARLPGARRRPRTSRPRELRAAARHRRVRPLGAVQDPRQHQDRDDDRPARARDRGAGRRHRSARSRGYYGRYIDGAVVWLFSVVSALPEILIVVAISFVLGKGMVAICVAMGSVGWITLCRLVRGEFIKHRGREYVLASRLLGASDLRADLRAHPAQRVAPGDHQRLARVLDRHQDRGHPDLPGRRHSGRLELGHDDLGRLRRARAGHLVAARRRRRSRCSSSSTR